MNLSVTKPDNSNSGLKTPKKKSLCHVKSESALACPEIGVKWS
jgi:hypothetical protein